MSILEDIRAFVPGCEQEQRDREAMLARLDRAIAELQGREPVYAVV